MNREDSIIEALKMWEWLSENSNRSKADYEDKIDVNWENYCPFCEFAKQADQQVDCDKCPAYGEWGTEESDTIYEVYCESKGRPTPWDIYRDADRCNDYTLKVQGAKNMVELIKRIGV